MTRVTRRPHSTHHDTLALLIGLVVLLWTLAIALWLDHDEPQTPVPASPEAAPDPARVAAAQAPSRGNARTAPPSQPVATLPVRTASPVPTHDVPTPSGSHVASETPQRLGTGDAPWPWDEIAACESSGDWQANTGNGFYGGLQFTLSSWRSVGGVGYPNAASVAEQVKRGRLLQAVQGWGAWPYCSAQLGLS